MERVKRWASDANSDSKEVVHTLLKASPGSISDAPFSAEKSMFAGDSKKGRRTDGQCASSVTLNSSSAQKLLPSTYHFESVMQMDFQCVSCHYQHDPRYEKYRDLSLDLTAQQFLSQLSQEGDNNNDDNEVVRIEDNQSNQPVSQQELRLEELLQSFMKDEIRDLRCPHCANGNQVCIKKRFVWLAPTLVLQFKRFRYDPMTQSFKKVGNPVKFSESISLIDAGLAMDHFHERTLGENVDMLYSDISNRLWTNSAVVEEEKKVDMMKDMNTAADKIASMVKTSSTNSSSSSDSPSPSHHYQLSAVVRHLGRSLESGHYICDLFENKSKGTATEEMNEWRRYNDDRVFPIAKVCLFLIDKSFLH